MSRLTALVDMAEKTECSSSCSCLLHGTTSCSQTLDEIDFERGIWSAARDGELDRTKKLLKSGVDPKKRDSAGYTALHYGSRNGHADVCECLLTSGADVNAVTSSGRATPLHRAAFCGHSDVIRILLKFRADVLLRDSDGQTALHKAAAGGHYNVIQILVKESPDAKNIRDNRSRKPINCAKGETNIQEILS
eukprot:m.2213 g.2213  ORF g.2213 m.2213 type:complete len:192 (+) comp8453_c0_seq1:94-669(+)